MKKKIILFSFVVSLLLIAVFASASANTVTKETKEQWKTLFAFNENTSEAIEETGVSQFKLPASLTTIEESAFEGTAITSVELPESVVTIDDYAFAGIRTLRKISIPNNIQSIGENAFKGSNNVTITGAPKGYARAYAQENGIPFEPITSFYAGNLPVQITGLLNVRIEEKLFTDGEAIEGNTPRQPTGRMTGDINADKNEYLSASHIQGRSPPIG